MQMRSASQWERKALKTADLLKQKTGQRHNREANILYIDVFLKNLSVVINTRTSPLVGPHQFEVWILPAGVYEEKKWGAVHLNSVRNLYRGEPGEMNERTEI